VKGWPGNKEGFKPEMFARHSLYHNKSNHNECEKSYDKLMSGAPMIASVCPDISTFGSRISKSLKAQLSAKIVCANFVATEGMSDTKYKPILDSYEKLGVNVGETHRNSKGLSIFNAVHADLILEQTIKELEDERFFGRQGDGSHDKARKPQEATNIRAVDKSTGRPKIIGLEFSKLRHQDACTTRDAMFSTLQKHRVSKAVAEKKMVS